MKTNVRYTSLDAYFTLRRNGVDINQKGMVYDCIKSYAGFYQGAMTRNEIASVSRIRLGSVCARVNEMIADSWLTDDEKRKCSVTGKEDHVVRVAR